MLRCVWSMVLVVAFCAAFVGSARAQAPAAPQGTQFRDAGAWCSLTFPKDWKQVDVAKAAKFKREANLTGAEFRMAFTKTIKNGEMDFPCAILVAQPHKMSGIRLRDIEERYAGDMRIPIFAGVQTGELEYYLADRLIVHTLSISGMKGADGKNVDVKGRVFTYVTKNGFVHLAFFDTAKRFEASEAMFDEVVETVAIDRTAYMSDSSSRRGSGFRRGYLGIGGLGVGGILLLLRLWARSGG
jgi:hypothetical protein